jgi:transposase
MTDIVTRNDRIATIGMDLGKRSLSPSLECARQSDYAPAIVAGRLELHMANLQPCLVGIEACAGAHHIGRRLSAFGHNVRLIPGQHIKPFRKGEKNDYRDAEAIAEAVQPTMRFVPIKSAEQLDLQALHRIRVGSSATVLRSSTSFAAFFSSVALRYGKDARLREILPSVLAQRTDVLSRA